MGMTGIKLSFLSFLGGGERGGEESREMTLLLNCGKTVFGLTVLCYCFFHASKCPRNTKLIFENHAVVTYLTVEVI